MSSFNDTLVPTSDFTSWIDRNAHRVLSNFPGRRNWVRDHLGHMVERSADPDIRAAVRAIDARKRRASFRYVGQVLA